MLFIHLGRFFRLGFDILRSRFIHRLCDSRSYVVCVVNPFVDGIDVKFDLFVVFFIHNEKPRTLEENIRC